MSVISYPVPPYSNPPINPQFYQPSRFLINSIILGQTTEIITTVSNNYVIGQQVRLLMDPSSGASELNNLTAYIISILGPTDFILDIDSSKFSAFIFSANKSQIVAIGDINSGATNSSGRMNNGTFIPGSFIDISPN